MVSTFVDDPRGTLVDLVNPLARAHQVDSLLFRVDTFPSITIGCTFELLDVGLLADTGNQVNLLAREALFGLLEQVSMAQVEAVEDTVCVDSVNLVIFSCHRIITEMMILATFIRQYALSCHVPNRSTIISSGSVYPGSAALRSRGPGRNVLVYGARCLRSRIFPFVVGTGLSF